MLRFLIQLPTCLALASCLGCGASQSPASGSRAELGPHHAVLYRLPENQGFAEIVNEPEVTDRRGKVATAIVVYFLQPDEKSPLNPAPTDVRVTLEQGRKRAETLTLKPEPKSDDPAGACRFVTSQGPYLLEGVHGKLSGSVGGKTFDQAFTGGR
ncbi:MAG: hypothetical protein P4L84_08640 [Isosphaeraceae bacterium]|nr:hypothetical protein [Isosphaeraceae bacterium]